MYRCAKCGESNRAISNIGLQCDKCGSRIFVKERPNIRKVLKSD
ncbi:MAG: DNA-directed RNA polymerase subunit P [archaeon]|nr:DNA-directed RNA polymerase subunit P [archaeon]